jgi:hypothetical protein
MKEKTNKSNRRCGKRAYIDWKEERMTQKKPSKNKDVRVGFRTDAEWYAVVSAEASRMGLSLASYLRLAAIEKMDRDKAKRNDSKGD